MSLVSMLIFHSHLGSVILDTVTPPTSTAPTPPSAPAARLASSTTASPSWPRKIAGQITLSLSELTKTYSQHISFPPFSTPYHYHSCSGSGSLQNPNLYKSPRILTKTYRGPNGFYSILLSIFVSRLTGLLHFASHTQRGITVQKNTNMRGVMGSEWDFSFFLTFLFLYFMRSTLFPCCNSLRNMWY